MNRNKVQQFQLLHAQTSTNSNLSIQYISQTAPSTQGKKYSTQDALIHVGGSNTFQVVALIASSLTCGLLTQCIFFGLSFLQDTKRINFLCMQCPYEDACNRERVTQYKIDWSNTQHNFITDFDLVCEQDILISLQGAMYFVGFLIGAGVWLPLSDKFGRKIFVIWGFAVHLLIVGFILLVRRSWSTYIFFLLLGFHFPLISSTGYLLLMEVLSIKHAAIFCAAYNCFDGFNNIWLPIYYKYNDTWEYLFYGNLVATVVFGLVFYLFMPQSPRYYLSQRQFDNARKVFRKIANCNRRQMFKNQFQSQTCVSSMTQNQKSKVKMGIRQLCRPSNNLISYSIIVPILWFIIVLIYYGINLGLGRLKGDIQMNGILSGLAEMLGYLIGGLIAQFGGRKIASQLMYAITAISLILYPFINNTTVQYICIMLGKFGASSAFYLVILLTTQLFPTIFRGTAFAISNVAARVAGMIAPLVSSIFSGSWFTLLFGLLSCVSFVLMFFIQQTKGLQLNQNIEKKQQVKLQDKQ